MEESSSYQARTASLNHAQAHRPLYYQEIPEHVFFHARSHHAPFGCI